MVRKIIVALVPALLCDCEGRSKDKALSFSFPQVRILEADRKKDLVEPPKGTKYQSIICCRCHRDSPPNYMAVFQKLTVEAQDLSKWPDTDNHHSRVTGWEILSPPGWVYLGMVETLMGMPGKFWAS